MIFLDRPLIGALAHARSAARLDPRTLARLLAARELMDDRAFEPLSLAQIASAAQLSPHHFHRLYRAHFGLTPHQHLTSRRLERARWLLRSTSWSVTEICLEVGFESLGSFSDLFKRHVGVSPAAYRRRVVALGWAPTPPCVIPSCMMRRWMGSPALERKDRKIQEAPWALAR